VTLDRCTIADVIATRADGAEVCFVRAVRGQGLSLMFTCVRGAEPAPGARVAITFDDQAPHAFASWAAEQSE
jgi:hypothetical protein